MRERVTWEIVTICLSDGNMCKLVPIWSFGPLSYTPTSGNLVASEWHDS